LSVAASSTNILRPKNARDRAFAVGIVVKGLNGAIELSGGLLLLFLAQERIHRVVVVGALTWREYRQQRRPRATIDDQGSGSPQPSTSGVRGV
jgi:hypothetical protein